MSDVIVLTSINEEGYAIESLIIPLYDEEGNPNGLLNSPYLVPPNSEGFWKAKWDFDLKKWTEGNPEAALNAKKEGLIERYSLECDASIGDSFFYNGDEFPFKKLEDQQLFSMQLSFCLAFPEEEPIAWKTRNNGVKEFTREEFFNICKAGSNHLRGNLGALWKLEAYIEGLTSIEELDALGSFEEAKQKLAELEAAAAE